MQVDDLALAGVSCTPALADSRSASLSLGTRQRVAKEEHERLHVVLHHCYVLACI